MGAPDQEALHAALRERYELQSREKSQAMRSEADAALHGEVDDFLARRPDNSSTPETLTKQFCAARRSGCSWPEALVALALAFEGTPQPRREPADNERATQRMAGSRPSQPLEACSRVPAASLDPATFLEQYVAASKPVVLTGLLDDWAAVKPSSARRWDLDYLWRKAANSTVKAYVSPDGEYEAVRRANDVVGGERVCAGCADDEQVLLRPAETELRLEHFLWLVKGYENPERAAFYLQKHPLSKWRGLGLVEDVTPPPHERLAPFLRPLHELLWLATQCTVGPLHYDEQENLHAMVRALVRPAATLAAPRSSPAPPRPRPSRFAQVRGRKVFELFHPAEGAGPLYDGQKMRSKHLLWRWRAEAMRGELMSLDPSKMEPTHVPFSPVRLRRPDLAAHPAFASSRRLLCEVSEGDVLYLPSCAPHWALGGEGGGEGGGGEGGGGEGGGGEGGGGEGGGGEGGGGEGGGGEGGGGEGGGGEGGGEGGGGSGTAYCATALTSP
jgi:hypothetical protein